MAWLVQSGSLLVAALVLFGPGVLIGWILRLRGLALYAFAPVATAAAAGLLAVLFPFLGVRWNAVSFGIGVVLIAAVAWGVARWLLPGKVSAHRTGSGPLLLIALLIGGVLIGIRLALYIGEPGAISQSNDAVFHLNALRYIAETGSASSLTLTGVLGATSVYPAAWHALVSLVIDLNGGDMAIAVNSVSLVIAVLVWPAGIAWLTRSATGSGVIAALAAALSGAMLHFPMLMLEWGVLYPNALALALLPAAVAVVIDHDPTSQDPRSRRIGRTALLIAVAVVALGFAQPVAVLTWILLIATLVFVRGTAEGAASRMRRVLVIAGFIVGIALVWLGMSYVAGGALWGPYANGVEALQELVLSEQVDLPASPLVSILTLLGIWAAWRKRPTRWLVVAWGGFAVMMFLVTAVANPFVRRWVLGPWYADPYRIAATLPVVMIPLMAIGLFWLFDKLRNALPKRAGTDSGLGAIAIAVVAAVGIIAVALWPVVLLTVAPEGKTDAESRYASSDVSYLSVDERTLLERLDQAVEPGALIIANPSTGSGFGYALSGANVYPRNWSHPVGEAWATLGAHLRDAADRPDVCEALHAYGDPHYVLDFGPGDSSPGRYVLPGMTGFASVDGFELVTAEGDAELWRITACDATD